MRDMRMNELVRNVFAIKRKAGKNSVVFDKTLFSVGVCCPL